jgi:L-alanine-DL-glutamate epimerase-like enolase superfamily enzyme
VLYRDLHAWIAARGYGVLLADGEGDAAPGLLSWAAEGLIDVLQYDLFSHGLTRWLETGRLAAEAGIRVAPHHYGTAFGNYAGCHLAAGVPTFTFVEWDEAAVLGMDASGYRIEEGVVVVPETSGFGLTLDDDLFRRAVTEGGFALKR